MGARGRIRKEPVIRSVVTALPANYADQASLVAALREAWAEEYRASPHWRLVFEQVQRTLKVEGRHLAMSPTEYPDLDSFAKRNAAWARVASELSHTAGREALARAGVPSSRVDHIFFVTSTGIATPSLDTALANRLAMRPRVKRTPIFGLGCAGGVGALGRASDYLRAFCDETALVVCVELCSLTFQRDDHSTANVIGALLFGDAAAAAVLSGDAADGARGPRILGSRSVLYAGTQRLMGWDVVDTGFKIVLSPDIPELIRSRVGADVDAFLSGSGIDRSHISHWIAHPGGNKVLEALEGALELHPHALDLSWKLLARTGNLSSASVLFVLADLLESGNAHPGDYGLMLAFGPGFCAELMLLQW